MKGKFSTEMFWNLKGVMEYRDTESSETAYNKYLGKAEIQYAVTSKVILGGDAGYGTKEFFESDTGREDSFLNAGVSSSFLLGKKAFGYIGYRYIINQSISEEYDYSGYSITGMLSFDIKSDYMAIQVLCQYQQRDYHSGERSGTLALKPVFLMTIRRNSKVLVGYQYLANDDSDPLKDFVENRYLAGLYIKF